MTHGAEDLGGLAELRNTRQRLTIELGGGAGFGDPCQRPIEHVQRDLDDGLITSEGLAEYGCELNQGQVRRA